MSGRKSRAARTPWEPVEWLLENRATNVGHVGTHLQISHRETQMTSGSQHFIVATAGHVDHGKSALVKALTGTDPDRLPEEKSRAITIDLGFAHLELPSSKPAPSSFLLGVVDVPGHEDFVKNMVAGVGSIDLALLVVAADDGWMPQTEEHLQILTYLGVRRAVVALTKMDLATDELGEAAAIREQLQNTPLAGAPIIPTSVVSGLGLDQLKVALANVLEDTPSPADIGKPRLPVDRVFKLQGIGTVITGTLAGGTLRRGQTVVIQPSGKKARVRTIQSHNRDVEVSGPGTRTALNLPDLNALGRRSTGRHGNAGCVWWTDEDCRCATGNFPESQAPPQR